MRENQDEFAVFVRIAERGRHRFFAQTQFAMVNVSSGEQRRGQTNETHGKSVWRNEYVGPKERIRCLYGGIARRKNEIRRHARGQTQGIPRARYL